MFIAQHPSFGPLMCVCFLMQFSERSTTHVSSLLGTEQLCLLFWDTAETSRLCPTLRAFGGSWKHCRGNPGLWVGPCGFRLWAFLPVCSCIDFLCNQDPQVRVQQPNASPLRTSWGPRGGSGHSFSLVQKASLKTDMATSPSSSSWLLSSLVIKLHSKAWAVKDGVGVGRFDFLIRGIFCRLEERKLILGILQALTSAHISGTTVMGKRSHKDPSPLLGGKKGSFVPYSCSSTSLSLKRVMFLACFLSSCLLV